MKIQNEVDLVIGNRNVNPDDAVAVLEKTRGKPAGESQPGEILPARNISRAGLRNGVASLLSSPCLLEGSTLRTDRLHRDHHGPRAVLNALERLADGYAFAIENTRGKNHTGRIAAP